MSELKTSENKTSEKSVYDLFDSLSDVDDEPDDDSDDDNGDTAAADASKLISELLLTQQRIENARRGDNGDKDNSKMDVYDWMQSFVSAILLGIFIFVFVGRTIGVEGNSMQSTLQWNDRVIMSGLFYTPKNGDIIIFRPPTDAFGNSPLVKRVIATEGQTIDINFDTGEVFVDGVVIDESAYINEVTRNRINFTGKVTVPEGHVFVMGDNRNHSSDSRDSRIGMVDTRYILGKVLLLLVPGENGTGSRDWRRIGRIT